MKFLNENKLKLMIRAHECVMDGFERFAYGHLITRKLSYTLSVPCCMVHTCVMAAMVGSFSKTHHHARDMAACADCAAAPLYQHCRCCA